MRDKAVSAITWGVIILLGIADAEGWGWAKPIIAVLFLLWLFGVALPWVWSVLGDDLSTLASANAQ
jgi:hypothetical protein